MTSTIGRLRGASRINLAALAVAALALFVALGGTSYAAGLLIGTKQIKPNAVTSGKIKNNRVSSADLKDNGVKSADLADGGIQMTDLSDPLQAKVNEVGGGGLIDTGQLANGAVTNPKLGTNSVSSSKVAANSLSSGDLGASSVGGSEIAAGSVATSEIATNGVAGAEIVTNGVQGDEIENGSLDAADVGQLSGSVGASFPVIPNGSCGFVIIDPTPGPSSIADKASVVTPGEGFGGNVSFHAEAESGSLRLKACNSSGAPVDPDGAGTNYNYIVFG